MMKKYKLGVLIIAGLLVSFLIVCVMGGVHGAAKANLISGEYFNPSTRACLFLQSHNRELFMIQGETVLSQGRYFIRWNRLFCSNQERAVEIGTIQGDKIETNVGPFIRLNSTI